MFSSIICYLLYVRKNEKRTGLLFFNLVMIRLQITDFIKLFRVFTDSSFFFCFHLLANLSINSYIFPRLHAQTFKLL